MHTRQSSIQSDKYQVSHRYSCFSWWWAHIRPKHAQKRNIHTKKNCAPSWLYLQDCVRPYVTATTFPKLYGTIKPCGKCGRSQACIVGDGTYKYEQLTEVQSA